MTSSASINSTTELINLFSQTIQSLSEDAIAVKQVSSLQRCLQQDDDDNPEHKDHQDMLIQQLWQIHDLVTGLEDKVSALRQILTEEKRSVAKFESTLKQEAQEQHTLIEQMLQALQNHDEEQQQEQNHRQDPQSTLSSVSTNQDGSIDTYSSTIYSDEISNISLSSHRVGSQRRDSVDPRAKPSAGLTTRKASTFATTALTTNRGRNLGTATSRSELENQHPVIIISLPRITQEEFDVYKANNTRAPRISLLDLNEALEEIEQVVQVQHHATQVLQWRRKQHQQQQHYKGSVNMSLNSVQRRYDYLDKRQQHPQHRHLPFEGGGESSSFSTIPTSPLVAEQELRENCPFFRHGESTARSTLSVLCQLKRLKQLPSKNQQVMYQLLLVD